MAWKTGDPMNERKNHLARNISADAALCGRPAKTLALWHWNTDIFNGGGDLCMDCYAVRDERRAELAAADREERDRKAREAKEAKEAKKKRPDPSARPAAPAPEPPAPAEATTRPTPGAYPAEALGVRWEDLEASRFTQNDDHKATEERPRKARLVTVRGFPYLNTGGHWNGIAADGRRFDEIQLTPAYPEEGWDGPRTARPDPGTGYLGMPVSHRGKRYRLGHKDERVNIHRFKETAPAPSEPPAVDQADEEQAPEVDLRREHNARLQAEEQAEPDSIAATEVTPEEQARYAATEARSQADYDAGREPVPGAISAMTAALPHNGPTAEDRAAKRRGPYKSDREWDIWIEDESDHPYSSISAPTRKEATEKAIAAFPGFAPAQMTIAPAADRYAIRDRRADARARAREKEEARRAKEEEKQAARSERQAKADRAREEKERAKEEHARARADMPTAEEHRAAVEAKNRVDAMMARAVRGEHDDAGRAEWRLMIEQHEAMKDRDPETLVIFARPYGWHEILSQDALEYGRITDDNPSEDQATGIKFVLIPDIDAACRRIIEAGRRAVVVERVQTHQAEGKPVERIVTPGRIDEPAEAPPAPKARKPQPEPRPEPQAMREWACLDGKGRCLTLIEATNAEAALRIANIGAPIKAVRAVPNEE